VQLTPGPNNKRELPEGGVLTTETTTTPVELDQVLDMLDERTRRHLAEIIQGSATALRDKGEEFNLTLRYLNPALAQSTRLFDELTRDQEAFTDFLVNTSRVVNALGSRREQLAQLIGNANTTTRAIASQSEAFNQTLAILPATLNQASDTFVNLQGTLDDLDVLVAAAKPATRELTQFVSELRILVDDATPAIRDLRHILRQAGANNDLLDLFRVLPKLANIAIPTFSNTIEALKQTQPVIEFARPYTPELIGWFRDFGQGASSYDANGHYARIMPITNSFTFAEDGSGGVLTPNTISQRLNGYSIATKSCPGGASQPTPDGSAPFTESGRLDCDPQDVPPGP
jgi:phospholipid/cholesterol/gamma-HCH transport system substrate-binding protein